VLARGRQPCRVLVSDIDGTLLRDGRPTDGLDSLRRRITRHGRALRLVYATGRSFESTWKLVGDGTLPRPDAVAACVGTELMLPPWRTRAPSYDRQLTVGWGRKLVHEVAGRVPGLEPQPAWFQTWAKVSFYVREDDAVRTLRREFRRRGIKARIVASHGLYLDIIPLAAGKRNAVKHLLWLWGMNDAQVLAAGDSGNDRDMLLEPRFQGVAVGNGEKTLRRTCETDPGAVTSTATYASGVLEGAKAHGFWP
jgi:sucrose-6F-phosphate phosphohydrolase